MNVSNNLLSSKDRLNPGDAVSAIITLEDGSYLMQWRDDKPDIFYPDHWGMFGGAVDAGEEAVVALERELYEELRLVPKTIKPFISFDFDLTDMGGRKIYRAFFEVPIEADSLSGLVLGEGREMRAHDIHHLLLNELVVPYDSFALWLHASQHRLDMD